MCRQEGNTEVAKSAIYAYRTYLHARDQPRTTDRNQFLYAVTITESATYFISQNEFSHCSYYEYCSPCSLFFLLRLEPRYVEYVQYYVRTYVENDLR